MKLKLKKKTVKLTIHLAYYRYGCIWVYGFLEYHIQ